MFRYLIFFSMLMPCAMVMAQTDQCYSDDLRLGDVMAMPDGQTTTVHQAVGTLTLSDGFHAKPDDDQVFTFSSVLQYPLATGEEDGHINWLMQRTYDGDGQLVGASKSFFDERGMKVQDQVMHQETGQVLASQPMLDALGRTAGHTLSAPIQRSGFVYMPNFVLAPDGSPYNADHFDVGSKRHAPDPVGTQYGTLGWYYSDENTLESHVPASGYPYSRMEYYEDGTSRVKSSASPGEAHRLGAGHETQAFSFPLTDELLGHYAEVYEDHIFPGSRLWKMEGNINVELDADKDHRIAFVNADGQLLATALPNGTSAVQTVEAELDISMPKIYYANVHEYISELIDNDTLHLKILGNHYVEIYDLEQMEEGTNSDVGLLYRGLTINGSLSLPIESEQSSGRTNIQVRSLSDFDYQVLRSDGNWTHREPVFSNERLYKTGNEFYIPPGTTKVSLSNYAAYTIKVQLEELLTGTTRELTLPNGGTELNLIGGFYRINRLEDSAALSGYPLRSSYGYFVKVKYSYSLGDWSYYYHDEADRLIASISPNGVRQLRSGEAYEDIDKNTYHYNHQGWLLSKSEKETGLTRYMYRKDGLLRFYQDAAQVDTDYFNYFTYDDVGRQIAKGSFKPYNVDEFFLTPGLAAFLEKTGLEATLPDRGFDSRFNKVVTFYDLPDPDFSAQSGQNDRQQEFVHARVSFTENSSEKNWFSYDEQGRLSWVVKHLKSLDKVVTIDYAYDFLGQLISLEYQKGEATEYFAHHYTYNRDLQLTQVHTQAHAEAKKLRASYEYYLHGPLKRVVLGEGLQGTDYVYTIQGWLKSINHPQDGRDPGSDGTNGVEKDVFSMSMDYFSGDYVRAGTGIGNLDTDKTTSTYNGNIATLSWYQPFGGTGPVAYNLLYDYRDQFNVAEFGQADFNNNRFIGYGSTSVHFEAVTSYDPNGNINFLVRTNADGQYTPLSYRYLPNSNRLEELVDLSNSNTRNYEYDASGRMTKETFSDSGNKDIRYGAPGQVSSVMNSIDSVYVSFGYGTDGLRSSKGLLYFNQERHYETENTYYVRDANGLLLATYGSTGSIGSPNSAVSLQELMIHGQGRLGTYYPEKQEAYYELKDHLGHVRAVVSDGGDNQTYTATMETARIAQESNYFDFPAGTVKALGTQMVAQLDATHHIGPNIILQVMPGDQVLISADGAYHDPAERSAEVNTTPLMAAVLSAFTGTVISPESDLYAGLSEDPGAVAALGAKRTASSARGYLNYMLLGPDLKFLDAGYVGLTAKESLSANNLSFSEMQLDMPEIEQPGYLFVYTSNESEGRSEVYFDNLAVQHAPSMIKQLTDYYPFGLEMAERSFSAVAPKDYRFAYQGNFAEKDKETGWNSFELRQYDPFVGKWTTPDPYGQYSSPYRNGNNPMNQVDPDGGREVPDDFVGPLAPDDWYVSDRLNNTSRFSAILQDILANSSRPDIDGFVNMSEGIGWAKQSKDALYLDGAKLDLGFLTIEDLKNLGITQGTQGWVNLLDFVDLLDGSSIATTYALGNTQIRLVDEKRGIVQLYSDDYDWDYHNYTPNGKWPTNTRDRLIHINRALNNLNDSHGFPVYIYGTTTLNGFGSCCNRSRNR